MSYKAFRVVSWAVVAVVAWVLFGLLAHLTLGTTSFGFSEFALLLVLAAIFVPAFLVCRLLWRLGNRLGSPPR